MTDKTEMLKLAERLSYPHEPASPRYEDRRLNGRERDMIVSVLRTAAASAEPVASRDEIAKAIGIAMYGENTFRSPNLDGWNLSDVIPAADAVLALYTHPAPVIASEPDAEIVATPALTELRSTLATMKSANAKRVNMNVWESDIKAVEDAVATIEAIRAYPAPNAEFVAALEAAREYIDCEVRFIGAQEALNLIDATLAKAKGGSAPVSAVCAHPNGKLWFYRDGDTFMRCPDCGARWCK